MDEAFSEATLLDIRMNRAVERRRRCSWVENRGDQEREEEREEQEEVRVRRSEKDADEARTGVRVAQRLLCGDRQNAAAMPVEAECDFDSPLKAKASICAPKSPPKAVQVRPPSLERCNSLPSAT